MNLAARESGRAEAAASLRNVASQGVRTMGSPLRKRAVVRSGDEAPHPTPLEMVEERKAGGQVPMRMRHIFLNLSLLDTHRRRGPGAMPSKPNST